MKYDFDPEKNEINLSDHGLDFGWLDGFDWDSAVIASDDRKDYGEKRVIAFGFLCDRLTCLVYTERGDVVRAISWRKANKREVRSYEKAHGG